MHTECGAEQFPRKVSERSDIDGPARMRGTQTVACTSNEEGDHGDEVTALVKVTISYEPQRCSLGVGVVCHRRRSPLGLRPTGRVPNSLEAEL